MVKSTAKLVLEVLEENDYARKNNFRYLKAPSFETVTRCRRHIQKKRPDLVDEKTDKCLRKREKANG